MNRNCFRQIGNQLFWICFCSRTIGFCSIELGFFTAMNGFCAGCVAVITWASSGCALPIGHEQNQRFAVWIADLEQELGIGARRGAAWGKASPTDRNGHPISSWWPFLLWRLRGAGAGCGRTP